MDQQADFGGQIVWMPTPEQADGSRLAAFLKAHSIPIFAELQRRSSEGIGWFWDAVIQDLDICYLPSLIARNSVFRVKVRTEFRFYDKPKRLAVDGAERSFVQFIVEDHGQGLLRT